MFKASCVSMRVLKSGFILCIRQSICSDRLGILMQSLCFVVVCEWGDERERRHVDERIEVK